MSDDKRRKQWEQVKTPKIERTTPRRGCSACKEHYRCIYAYSVKALLCDVYYGKTTESGAEIIEKRAACDREDTDCAVCFKESHCKALAKAHGKEIENA